ncbi:MAG: hypothetical protein ACI8XO_004764 [Verrucomicrobiales bacterium]
MLELAIPFEGGEGVKFLKTLVLVLLVGFISGCNNYETEEVEIGYLGEARFNPFLAAGRLLEQSGYDVARQRSREALPDFATTVVVPAESIENLADAKRYQNWIEDGGHVIYLTSGYGMLAWRERSNDWKIEKQQEREHPLLEQFDIGIETVLAEEVKEERDVEEGEDDGKFEFFAKKKNYEPGEVMIYSEPLDVLMRSEQWLDSSGSYLRPDVVLGTADKAQLLSMPVGAGRLSIMTSAYPIRNRYIGERDHATLFFELIQTHGTYQVNFLYGGGTTFFAMLLEHGWMPLLGLVILCVFWIWKNLPRFGPAIPQVDVGERQFTDHIEMTGRFLWNHKASSALLTPVVSHIRRGLQQRHPQLAGDADAQIEYFVENTKLSQEEIAEAMLGAPASDPATMTRVVKNLKILTESL